MERHCGGYHNKISTVRLLGVVQVTRPIGSNDIGVVVWAMTLRTPEWPHGRQAIAIANDITFQAGALSPREHAMFRAAADLAHKRQLPLIYLAANSGAKVGLDQELKQVLQVQPFRHQCP